jgi:hypothetical protein
MIRLESSFPKLVPFGAEMLQWLSQGGSPRRVGTARQLAMRWRSFWFEHQLARQQRLPPTPTQSRRDPVLILGLWRSGTTAMHNLLAALPGMITPTNWQCMNPATVRLRGPPRSRNAVTRPMGHRSSEAFAPQEEELALLALGAPSVYRGFFDPRRLPELACLLDETSWTGVAFATWLKKWLEFSECVSAGRKGRLLLKSPAHTFRIPALIQAMPQASYVWLVREPRATFISNRKMWLSKFHRYALWDWSEAELDAFLVRAVEATARSLECAVGSLPPEKLVVVEFERVIRAPTQTSDAIGTRLGLIEGSTVTSPRSPSPSHPHDAIRSARQADTSLELQLPPGASAALERLGAAMQVARASHGL